MDSVPRGRLVLNGVAHAGVLVALADLLIARPFTALEKLAVGAATWPLLGLPCAVLVAMLVVGLQRSSRRVLLPLALGACSALFGAWCVHLHLKHTVDVLSNAGSLRGGWSPSTIYALALQEGHVALVLGLVTCAVGASQSGWAAVAWRQRRLGGLCLGLSLVSVVLLVHARSWYTLHQAAGQEAFWGAEVVPAVSAGLARLQAASIVGWLLIAALTAYAIRLSQKKVVTGSRVTTPVLGALPLPLGVVTLWWGPAAAHSQLSAFSQPILWDVEPARAFGPMNDASPRRYDTLFLGSAELRLEHDETVTIGARARLADGQCGDLLGDAAPDRLKAVSLLVDRTLTFRELVCALVALQYGPPQQADAMAELPWGMRAAAHHDFDWRWRALLMVQDESLREPYAAVTRRFGEVGVRLVTQHEGGMVAVNQDQWSYRVGENQGNLRGDLISRMQGVRALLKTAREPVLLTAAPNVSAEEVLNAALAFEQHVVRILPSASVALR